nr:hypothetical protein [uncultured Hyphomonas sp.]
MRHQKNIRPEEAYVDVGRTFSRASVPEDDDAFADEGWFASSEIPWTHILHGQVNIILASAGSGKTEEFKAQARAASSRGVAGWFCAIEELADEPIEDVLDLDGLSAWKQGEGEAIFFLDSVDESKLVDRHGFQRALRKLRKLLGDHASRALYVISCRPSDWNPSTDGRLVLDTLQINPDAAPSSGSEEEGLGPADEDARLLGPVLKRGEFTGEGSERAVREPENEEDTERLPLVTWTMNPLSLEQAGMLAREAEGVEDEASFLDAIRQAGLEPFAKRPADLLDLAAYWKRKRQFGTLREMIEGRILRLLQEQKSHRRDGDVLSEDEAFRGASCLAAAMILGKRLTLSAPGQTSGDHGDHKPLRADLVLTDWTAAKREALLRRGLFAPASFGRIRFQHRSSLEYLAAAWFDEVLKDDRHAPQVLSLLFPVVHDVATVTPELRPVAAWLAGRYERIRDMMLEREPMELIRYGDPRSLPLDFRARLLRRLAEADSEGRVSDLYADQRAIWAFATPDLAPAIREAWPVSQTGDVRHVLLALIREGKIGACADLAYEAALVPAGHRGSRAEAVAALIALDDKARLRDVARRLIEGEFGNEAEDLADLARLLYPDYISTDALLGLIRDCRPPPRNLVGGFGRRFEQVFNAARPVEREPLLTGIAELVGAPDEKGRAGRGRHAYLAADLPALAEAAMNQLDDPAKSPGTLKLLMQIERQEGRIGYHGSIEDVRAGMGKSRSLNRALFLADVEYICARKESGDLQDRPWMGYYLGVGNRLWSLQADDIGWLIEEAGQASRPETERLTLFHAALDLADRDGSLETWAEAFRNAARGNTIWLDWLNKFRQPRSQPGWVKKQEKQKKKRERDEKKRNALLAKDWVGYRDELRSAPPAPDFSAGLKGPSWKFMNALTRWLSWETNERKEKAPRHWRRLVPVFGEPVAASFRDHFQSIWRQMPAQRARWTGGNSSTPWSSIFAYAGLGVEADLDDKWADQLGPEEVQQACRHLVLGDQGIPDWMWSLLQSHELVLLPMLRSELKRQWVSANEHPRGWLEAFAYQDGPLDPRIAKIAFPILTNASPGEPGKWEYGIRILRKMTLNARQWKKLSRLAIEGAEADDATIEDKLRFLGLLCLCDINAAIDPLEQVVSGLDQPEAQFLLGKLFNDRYGGMVPETLRQASVATLERLVELVYRQAPVSEDEEEDDQDEDGIDRVARSVGSRDYAEAARNAILSVLIEHPDQAAYEAMCKFAKRPDIAPSEYWFSILSKRMVERGVALAEWDEADFVRFETSRILPVKTQGQFFELLRAAIAKIEDDFKNEDASSQRVLETARNEAPVQDWLFEQIRLRLPGRCHRVKEAEVAGRKRPDLIVASTELDGQVAIEVKHGDKDWTLQDLRDTISVQLVGRYLRTDNRRSGILVVTRHRKKYWIHPDTGQRMSFDAVLEDLSNYAAELARDHGVPIRLAVIGIDASS